MRRIKLALTTFAFLASFSVSGLGIAQASPLTVIALQGQSDACSGLSQLGGTHCDSRGKTPGQDAIAGVAKTIVNIISLIAGIVAVIFIVISGVRFIISGGDSQATASARSALIYALIGLVVVALAQLIVHFALNAAINNNTGTS